MLVRRTTLALIALSTTFFGTPMVNACWLTNCLYGRPRTPYVVGYAPAAPVAGQSSYRLPIATPVANQAVALQRPAYIDNPSVYTGRPVLPTTSNPYAAMLPANPVTSYRGASTTSNPFYGTGNLYPNSYQAATPAVAAPTAGLQPVTSFSPPVSGVAPPPASALPATTITPVAVQPAKPAGGLARFFGRLFGTNYRSSYYAAPVTYYRPVTSLDPVSGTTVTTQQACSSYSQQLQRVPVTSFQVPATTQPSQTVQPLTNSTCDTGLTPTTGYGPSSYAPLTSTNTAPLTGTAPMPRPIGQASTFGVTPGNVTSIPSTSDALPPTSPPPSDAMPMSQPRLGDDATTLNRPLQSDQFDSRMQSSPSVPSDGMPADGQWRVKSSSDPAASQRLDSASSGIGVSATSELATQSAGRFGSLRPIPAPANYQSPFRTGNRQQPMTSPAPPEQSIDRDMVQPLSAPGTPSTLPALSESRYQKSQPTQRVSVPVREASLERLPEPDRPVSQPRATMMIRETNSRSRQLVIEPNTVIEPINRDGRNRTWYSAGDR